jgi:phytoene dehydrogenase-like protein
VGAEAYDVAVIGAGFGGLGAALRLAELGARVVVCERLAYPGGCASTFQRDGCRFESGATLFSGLARGQLFGDWIARHGLDVAVDWLDPVVELRTADWRLPVRSDRAALLRQLEAFPGAPRAALRRFFGRQRRVADLLWSLLEDPASLPPVDLRAGLRHVAALPRYLPLIGLVGRSLGDVLRRDGLDRFAPLITYLDGLCQITVQCSAAEAEAPFALGTMDYYWRGTGHVRGGIGRLAWGLVEAIRRLGGRVELSCRVRGLAADAAGWRLDTRRGPIRTERVVANLLPQDVARLVPRAAGRLAPLCREVEAGWGACMLYLAVDGDGLTPEPHHVQVVGDAAAPMVEGNHCFVSVSGARDGDRAPAGLRTVTVSTHVPMTRLRALRNDERGVYVAGVQQRMRETVAARMPELAGQVRHELTASPRTFERFTGRRAGLVGGIPRRRGLRHYWSVFAPAVAPGLHLVGDSVFPGQSTLATALGGVRLAQRLAGPGVEPVGAAPARREAASP